MATLQSVATTPVHDEKAVAALQCDGISPASTANAPEVRPRPSTGDRCDSSPVEFVILPELAVFATIVSTLGASFSLLTCIIAFSQLETSVSLLETLHALVVLAVGMHACILLFCLSTGFGLVFGFWDDAGFITICSQDVAAVKADTSRLLVAMVCSILLTTLLTLVGLVPWNTLTTTTPSLSESTCNGGPMLSFPFILKELMPLFTIVSFLISAGYMCRHVWHRPLLRISSCIDRARSRHSLALP